MNSNRSNIFRSHLTRSEGLLYSAYLYEIGAQHHPIIRITNRLLPLLQPKLVGSALLSVPFR